jgi:CheY-like chemotaxis protein
VARILVIDDSASVLELAGQILRQAGHEVVTAESGRRGESILASQPLDLVITDIYMPEEDGLEVIRKARRTCPGLRVLAMSVVTGKHGMLHVAKALGAAGTLLKPFAAGDLLDAVEGCLEGPTGPGGRRTHA